MPCCNNCFDFIGKFCTEDGTTVLGYVCMKEGVPTFQYFNLSDGERYYGIVFTDACNGIGGGAVYAIQTTPTTSTSVTNAALTGTVLAVVATGGGTWIRTDGFTQTGTTINLISDSWSLTQQLVIFQI